MCDGFVLAGVVLYERYVYFCCCTFFFVAHPCYICSQQIPPWDRNPLLLSQPECICCCDHIRARCKHITHIRAPNSGLLGVLFVAGHTVVIVCSSHASRNRKQKDTQENVMLYIRCNSLLVKHNLLRLGLRTIFVMMLVYLD